MPTYPYPLSVSLTRPAYRSFHIPHDAPFELKPSPGQGWGVFATRQIARGATILKERPLFVIRKPHPYITANDVWRAFQQLPPRQQQQFLLLRDNASSPFSDMNAAFAENSFNLATPDGLRPGPRPPAQGLFLLHSRLNHACVPNATIPTTDAGVEDVTSFATRDIAPGEEITFAYEPDFECLTGKERHQALGFACKCQLCWQAAPVQRRLSDARRRLVRGLSYLLDGVDYDGRRKGGIIVDPELKRAAEMGGIPISSWWVYALLKVFLLEEEGLLDDFKLQRLRGAVDVPLKLFKTEENVVVATRAMAQATWRGRLEVAFGLYGRRDAGDEDLAVVLRFRAERSGSVG